MKKPNSATTTKTAAKPAAAAKTAAAAKPAAAAAKPAAAAAAAVKAEIVTLRHLATSVAESQGLSQKQANEVLSETVDLIGKHLKKGARIRIPGLGTLEVRKRAARMGRNPATGETIKIKASKKVAFRAAKDLNEAI
jgi:DNA-binding protein HU-beta